MANYRDPASGSMRRDGARGRQEMAVREPSPDQRYSDRYSDQRYSDQRYSDQYSDQHYSDQHYSDQYSDQRYADQVYDENAPRASGTALARTGRRTARSALEPDQVPVPTKWSETVRHPLIIAGNAIFTTLILFSLVGGGLFVFVKQSFEAAGPLDADKVVNIPPHNGIRDIADILVREGVIDRPWIFVVSATLAKSHDELKFGEYSFTRQASLHDVINTLIDGKVVQHQITIPEGLTSEQIVQRLMEMDILSGAIKEIPKEGSMLPESYRYPRGTSREQVIARMQAVQTRLVQEIWEHRAPDLPLKTPQQLVILASIVEKETGRNDERSRVAAVFINRLRQHMKLQSDPTIIYGLVGGKGTLGRPIVKSEIEQHTPYNTYVIEGLPPGPIANPGRAALEAVANPARTRELYFVADGTGGHTFSETLEQHQKAVEHLRALERGQREGTAPPPANGPIGGRSATVHPPAQPH